MTTRGLRIAIAIVRAWTRAYTSHLDSSIRDARRAEIESDLWEQIHDSTNSTQAIDLWVRLLIGIPDDVRWSVGQRSPRLARRAIGLTAVSLTVAAIWWARTTASPIDAPPAPDAPLVRWINRTPYPPPPPPPPPLCNPPGQPVISPCTQWPRR